MFSSFKNVTVLNIADKQSVMNKKRLYIILILAYVAAMFYLALTPAVPGGFPSYTDKLVHLGEFFVLTLIVLKASEIYRFKNYSLVLAVIVLVAILTETAQLFTAYRTFSFLDLIADVIGIMLGFIVKRFIFDKN